MHGDLTISRIMKCIHNLPDVEPLCPWNSVKIEQKKYFSCCLERNMVLVSLDWNWQITIPLYNTTTHNQFVHSFTFDSGSTTLSFSVLLLLFFLLSFFLFSHPPFLFFLFYILGIVLNVLIIILKQNQRNRKISASHKSHNRHFN